MAANGLGSVNVQKFGGLHLSADPADVGLERSLSGTNFVVADDGSYVRTRDGMSQLGAASALSGFVCERLLPDTTGDKLLAIMNNGGSFEYVDSVDAAGAVTSVGPWTVSSGLGFVDAVNFGTPAAGMTFIASEGTLMRKYTGGVLSASVGKPRYLAVTPTSNRLVQANFAAAADSPSGALGSRSTVFFSDLGAPETYTATSYIHLRPGDGEFIRGVVAYKGQVFVFKDSTLFVFYGEGTLASGQPEFLYRPVSLAGRVTPASSGPLVAATSAGVYYLGLDGLYVTVGGEPRLVSAALSELFRTGAATTAGAQVWAAGSRIFMSLNQGGSTYVYVYSERSGAWSRWTSALMQFGPYAAWSPTSAPTLGSPEAVFTANGDTLLYTDDAATTDTGSAIASSYQAGFSDLGAPSVKTVVRAQVWGSGSVTHSMATDYGAADTGSALTLGVAPAVATAQDRTARRGTQFSFKLSATSGAWRVNSVGLHVRRPRPVGSMP